LGYNVTKIINITSSFFKSYKIKQATVFFETMCSMFASNAQRLVSLSANCTHEQENFSCTRTKDWRLLVRP